MSAEILLFTGVQRVRDAGTGAQKPLFHPGEAVEIHSYDWQLGDEWFAAEVIRQNGEWVACRVAGHGAFAVHVSRIQRAAPEVA